MTSTTPSPEGVTALVERLTELLAKASPQPWAFKPQEHDDWGTIRTTVANEDGWFTVVAHANDVGKQDLSEHRRNKTDPTEGNAALIVEAVNALPELLALANRISAQAGGGEALEKAERAGYLIGIREAAQVADMHDHRGDIGKAILKHGRVATRNLAAGDTYDHGKRDGIEAGAKVLDEAADRVENGPGKLSRADEMVVFVLRGRATAIRALSGEGREVAEGWQPIEVQPDRDIGVLYWIPAARHETTLIGQDYSIEIGCFRNGIFCEQGTGHDMRERLENWGGCRNYPTHYLPLPPTPKPQIAPEMEPIPDSEEKSA